MRRLFFCKLPLLAFSYFTTSCLASAASVSFDIHQTINVGTHPTAVAVGRWQSKDGVVRSQIVATNAGNDKLGVFLNDGTGTFDVGTFYELNSGFGGLNVGQYPVAVAVGLLDATHRPLLLNGIATANAATNNVSVFKVHPTTGAILGPDNYDVDGSPRSVAFARIFSQDYDDLITANYDTNTVSVLQGDALGNYGAHSRTKVNVNFGTDVHCTGPSSVAFTEIFEGTTTGSGFVVACAKSNTAFIFLNVSKTGTPDFHAAIFTNQDLDNPVHVVVADLNNKGEFEYIYTNFGDGTSNGTVVISSPGHPHVVLHVGKGPTSTIVTSVRPGSAHDLVVNNSLDGTLSIFLNNGDGTFAAPITVLATTATPITTLAGISPSIAAGNFFEGAAGLAVVNGGVGMTILQDSSLSDTIFANGFQKSLLGGL